jgi:hypothetical protein
MYLHHRSGDGKADTEPSYQWGFKMGEAKLSPLVAAGEIN